MSNTKKKPSSGNQSIEELQRRYEDLSHERTRVEERRASAQNQLAQLRKQAVEQFGTDDVEKLEKQLSDLRTNNEEKRRKYQEGLDVIDGKLGKIESKFSNDNAGVEQ